MIPASTLNVCARLLSATPREVAPHLAKLWNDGAIDKRTPYAVVALRVGRAAPGLVAPATLASIERGCRMMGMA